MVYGRLLRRVGKRLKIQVVRGADRRGYKGLVGEETRWGVEKQFVMLKDVPLSGVFSPFFVLLLILLRRVQVLAGTQRPLASLFMVLVASVVSGPGWSAESLRTLVEQGAYQQAYDQAVAQLDDRIGEMAFDFWYGLAAIETGRYGEGALAMERVLMVEPLHYRARLELARAYYLQGDWLAAQSEFTTVLEAEPPQNVAMRVKAYLTAIDRRLKSLRRSSRVFVRAGAGHDTNINSATTAGEVLVPALGIVTLDPSSREVEDQFAELETGGDLTYRYTKTKALNASIAIKARNHFSSDAFDTQTGGIRLGPQFGSRRAGIKFPVQFQQFNLDGSTLRRMISLGGEWWRQQRNGRRYVLFGQIGRLTYPDQAVRDADLVTVGGNVIGRSANGRRIVSLSIFYGDENARQAGGTYYGRAYFGGRAGGQWVFSPQWLLYVAVGAQAVKHDARDVIFAEVRKDDFYSLTVGSVWQLDEKVTVELELASFVNDSNLSLYEYDRSQFKGAVSYAF